MPRASIPDREIIHLRRTEGLSKQIERYTLKQLGGQWFIDHIEVIEEIMPAEILERLIPGQEE